jgi:hypothetical protein
MDIYKKRDESAVIVKNHFSEIGASTEDIFKYGWDSCAHLLNKENEELKAQLEIAKEALEEIDYNCDGESANACNIASDALERLKTTGK